MDFPAGPLPLPPAPEGFSDTRRKAYDRCVTLEIASASDKSKEKDTISARVFGWFLTHPPVPGEPVERLAQDINECRDQDDVLILGNICRDCLIHVFKRAGTPTPSRHPSRPSFEDQAAFYAMVIDPGPMDQRTSKAKALARDRYRCMFSGLIDDTSALAGLVETPLPVGPTATTAPTELCHIIPQGLLSRWEQDDERDRSSTCLARMFGDVQFPMDLSGPETHRLENVLTLNPIWHARFDSLKCYLESTTTPDLYVLKVWEPFIENGNSFLDLKSDNPDFPAPSPQLLAIHRSRAIVAHLSGAAKYVELHPEEDEEDRYAVLSGIRHDEPTAREVFIAALWARFPSARALAPQKME